MVGDTTVTPKTKCTLVNPRAIKEIPETFRGVSIFFVRRTLGRKSKHTMRYIIPNRTTARRPENALRAAKK
jgi:hypothetical protein